MADQTGGVSRPSLEAHHIYPQKYKEFFLSEGIHIDLNEARYGAWVDATAHHRWSPQYNRDWEALIKNKPSREQVFEFARKMGDKYRFKVMF